MGDKHVVYYIYFSSMISWRYFFLLVEKGNIYQEI